MNRRSLIKAIAGSALLKAIPANKVFGSVLPAEIKKPALRIAHITDIHLKKEKSAVDGFTKCLHHIQNSNSKPDIIINGGDSIHDALMHSKQSVQSQWNCWHSLIKNECSLTIEYAIGNHDVWGMPAGIHDPMYGKEFALEMMELSKPYRSFDNNGWHFIILDSTQTNKKHLWYTAKLDNEQFEWLKNDLLQTPASTPVIIISHIPILAACIFFDGVKFTNEKFFVPGTYMHGDADKILELFSGFKNIKLCLSGHIHLYDQVVYNGITFFCNGAVSGDWWKNEYYKQTRAGYAVTDLFADGSFQNNYISYNA